MTLEEWIVKGLNKIANELPNLVKENPASFKCGYSTGYKSCLLELGRFLETKETCDKLMKKYGLTPSYLREKE